MSWIQNLSQFLIQKSAFAQAAAAAPAAQPSVLEMLIMPVGIILVAYFFIIRPQSQKQKQQQKFISDLKRGDEVITSSGIIGRIEGLTEAVVTLEVADGVRMKFLRSQVYGSAQSLKSENNKGS